MTSGAVIDAIAVINAGSSSIKFALYRADAVASAAAAATAPASARLAEGSVDGIGRQIRFSAQSETAGDCVADDPIAGSDHAAAFDALWRWLDRSAAGMRVVAAGHRVVHGGARFGVPVRIDADVIAELQRLVPLAPLHQPHSIAAMTAMAERRPPLFQVACFDTAFHHTQSPLAAQFALPPTLTATGVRRFGFHGLSYEYVAGVLPAVLGKRLAEARIIVAHLGSGASLCALRARRSVATTMGMTPLDGLPMGSRCGTLDPGAVLYLIEQLAMTPAAVRELLYRGSGLLGVSGISDDMRTLLASADPRAAAAVNLFVYRIGREIGSLAAALGGLDALVFTGGIGEHAPVIRRRVCESAAWLGVAVDPAANDANAACISLPSTPVSAWVIPTDEDWVIARHTARLHADAQNNVANRS